MTKLSELPAMINSATSANELDQLCTRAKSLAVRLLEYHNYHGVLPRKKHAHSLRAILRAINHARNRIPLSYNQNTDVVSAMNWILDCKKEFLEKHRALLQE